MLGFVRLLKGTVEIPVIRPLAFTVICGIALPDPKVPVFELTLFNVKVMLEAEVVETDKSPITLRYLKEMPFIPKIVEVAPVSKYDKPT